MEQASVALQDALMGWSRRTLRAEKGAALAAAQAMLEEKVGALEEAKAEVSKSNDQ